METFSKSRWMWFLKGLPDLARACALFRIKRYTMTSPERCKALWDRCQGLLVRQVPGCFVECGVWRGGSAGIMGLALQHAGQNRALHLFDSFEGLPEPTAMDEAKAAEFSGGQATGRLAPIGQCQAGREEVETFLLGKLKLSASRVHFHAGWFQNTVPKSAERLEAIALLRLDGDWYESTQICLQHLYPKLSPGGMVVLDDYYFWAGCKKATDEYRERHGIKSPLVRIDTEAAYWIKD